MTADIFARLAAPFSPDRVSWRVGSVKKDGSAAMALAYIDARDVMERLDEVCTPAGWQCRYTHADRKTICELGIRPAYADEGAADEWIWKADGAGDSDIEAEKGALSDAFKRAAVRWGVGRYLYELPTPWVRIDTYKKILPEEETKLRKLLEGRLPPKVNVAGVITGRQLQDAQEAERYDPEPPLGSNRLSSFEASRQGIGEAVKAFIDRATTKELDIWEKNFDRNTGHFPAAWLPSIRDRIELRREELAGESNVAEASEELDAGFRGAVGSSRPDSVSGLNGDVAHA